MKYEYKKPNIKVIKVDDEPVMISTSTPIDSKQNIDPSDIGAKRSVVSDILDFPSSSSSSSSETDN